MALTLQVTSFQNQALGPLATKTFGPGGGTIGRRNDNDWVLPDPEKFVSGQHARIVCRGGVFYLCDLSSNGTFVNGAAQPVGHGTEQQLFEGDRVQIGEYEITVRLDAAAYGSTTGPSGFGLGGYATGPATGGSTGRTGPTGPLGADFFGGHDQGRPSSADPLDFFNDRSEPRYDPAASVPDHSPTMEHYYRPPQPESPPIPSVPLPGGAAGIPEDWDTTGYSRSGSYEADPFASLSVPGPGPVPGPVPRMPSALERNPVAPAPPLTGDIAGALAVLLQHAGMDAASAHAVAGSPALVPALGKMFGVAVQGMLEVLKARTEIKSQFRVPVTMMRPVENNPLKFSATPAQAMSTLLQQNPAYLGPVDAFVEGFQDIKAHQVAMMAGMRAAFDSMLQRFDPAELIERFEKRGRGGSLLSMPGKGRYWEMYTGLYEEWTQDADLNFQKLFGDEFARAYEEQMRRLTKLPRGGH